MKQNEMEKSSKNQFGPYQFHEENNYWYREDFVSLNYSDGTAVEQRIFDLIANAKDKSIFSRELTNNLSDWPTEYHLSPFRHCIVRPIGIKPGDSVLELGCGCGAITRYLGEIGAKVTSVEGSEKRARVAAERCRDLPNVQIIVDDLLKVDVEQSFDWVLLIGVLEYAPVYSKKSQPVDDYINQVRKYIAKNGKLVIAIENKLGLKYFNGCSEDHVGIPYYGIQNLYKSNTPVTFGKSELSKILEDSGFNNQLFYYPFPDYKLPNTIIADNAFKQKNFYVPDLILRSRSRDYGGKLNRSFEESLVFSSLYDNGLMQHLANSFLVVSSNHELGFQNHLAWTYSVNNRRDEFKTQTEFVSVGEEINIIKSRVIDDGRDTIACESYEELKHHTFNENYWKGEQVLWNIVKAKAVSSSLSDLSRSFITWVDYLLEQAVVNNDRKNLRDYSISGEFIDCTPFNLLQNDFKLKFIDKEWELEGSIPLGWVLYRGVYHSLGVGLSFESTDVVECVKHICSSREIEFDAADIEEWIQKEKMFQFAVTGVEQAGTLYKAMSNEFEPTLKRLELFENQLTAIKKTPVWYLFKITRFISRIMRGEWRPIVAGLSSAVGIKSRASNTQK